MMRGWMELRRPCLHSHVKYPAHMQSRSRLEQLVLAAARIEGGNRPGMGGEKDGGVQNRNQRRVGGPPLRPANTHPGRSRSAIFSMVSVREPSRARGIWAFRPARTSRSRCGRRRAATRPMHRAACTESILPVPFLRVLEEKKSIRREPLQHSEPDSPKAGTSSGLGVW